MSQGDNSKQISKIQQETSQIVSSQQFQQTFSQQQSGNSVTFQTSDGSHVSLNSETNLLSSTTFSSQVITVTKKTTTTTTTTYFSTNRKYPTKYEHTELKKNKVSGYLTYDNLKFDQQIFDRQVSVINSLPSYTDIKPPILETANELAGKLPASESDLKNSLTKAVQSKDSVSLTTVEPSLLSSYKNVIGNSEDTTGLSQLYLELLCYTSTFPKTSFCPLDASVRARDVASTLEDGQPLQNSLLIISNVLDADFISKDTQKYIISYLSSSSNIYVQKVRWIVQNIQEDLVVDDPSNAKLSIQRNIETPVVPPDTVVAQNDSLIETIKQAHALSENILALISEISPEEEENLVSAEQWYNYLNDINEALKEMEENPLHETIASKQKLFKDSEPKFEQFIEFTKIVNQRKEAKDLYTKYQLISTYLTYVDKWGNITYFTVDSALSDAQDAMATLISTSGLPDEVTRYSLFNASLTKMRGNLLHPGVKEEEFASAAQSIDSFLQITESKDVSLFLQIAQWELQYTNLYRSTVISSLKSTALSYESCNEKLEQNLPSVDNAEVKKSAEQWKGTISKNVEDINAMINSANPAVPQHHDQLVEMRNAFTPINAKRQLLKFDLESRLLAYNIDRSISLIKGEYYVPEPPPKPVSDVKRKMSFGRVQFAEGSSKDQFKDLYPKKSISHPVYQSWDPKKFAEMIKTNKTVPLDIGMISKITTTKLTSTRSKSRMNRLKTGATSQGVLNFKLYVVSEPDKVEPFKGTDAEIESAYEATEQSISNIEKNIFKINKKPLFDKYDFVENSAPGIQYPCFKDDQNLKNRYAKVYKKFNDLIVGLVTEPPLLLPRQAVDRIYKYMKCMIDTLSYYRDLPAVKNDKQGSSIAEKWYEYLSDSLRVISIINNADDEVAIASSSQFFLTFRSGLASFTTPAEKLDELTHRRSLSSLITTILRTMLTLIQFNQSIVYDEYCTVQSAQTQVDQLTEKFAQSNVAAQQKKLYEETQPQIKQIISASDVNTSTADSAAQLLRDVHLSLESDIRTPDDEEMSLFIETVGVRLSIINLHVSDADADLKLSELTQTVITDFDNLVEQVRAGEGGSQEISDLSKAWQNHLDLCERDVKGMNSVSPIASQSYSRYSTIADNAEDISNSLAILGDKRFPFSVSNYGKLSIHLDKLLDYVKGKRHGTQTRGRKQSDLSSVLQKHLLSIQSSKKAQQVTDNYFDEFANGFIQTDAQQVRDDITNNVSQSTESKSSQEYKINKLLGKLFAAHIESFARNYNISSKSTRVCYELLTEYTSSIIECTECAQKAVKSKAEYKRLKDLVPKHVELIQEIQNQYNDKTVYSDHARQRIIIFAHFCSISSQLTMLNINHLKAQDDQFDFDEVQVHTRATQQLLEGLSYGAASQNVFACLNDIQNASRMIDQNENDVQLPVLEILDSEKRYAESLSELVELLMLENDVRYWKVDEKTVKLTPLTAETEKGEGNETASDLKRSIDIVAESLVHFKTTLQDGDVTEDELMQQIDTLDSTVKVFCDSASSVDSDPGFNKLVQKFRLDTIGLCNYLRTELGHGTYTLYSLEASKRLGDVNHSAMSIIRHLGFMEMLEDEDGDVPSILSRLIKQLLLERDDFKASAKKFKEEADQNRKQKKEESENDEENEKLRNREAVIPIYADFSGDSFETIANVLLTIKNSDPAVLRDLYKKDMQTLRKIIFVSQNLVDEGTDLENCIQRTAEYPVESPEFLVKSMFQPIVSDLRKLKSAIPEAIPQSGYLIHCISSVITKMNIVIEPHFEDRPLIDMSQQ